VTAVQARRLRRRGHVGHVAFLQNPCARAGAVECEPGLPLSPGACVSAIWVTCAC